MNITDGERRRIEYQRNHKDIILKVLTAHLSSICSIELIKQERCLVSILSVHTGSSPSKNENNV